MAGWVFADLLLALTLVFIATQPGDPHAAERAAAESATSTTSTSTTTTTVPEAPGVDREYLCVRLDTDPVLLAAEGDAHDAYVSGLASELQNRLADLGDGDRRFGIALSFGVAQTPNEGRSIAESFNAAVLPALSDQFGESAQRAFWDGEPGASGPRGSIMLNVYPMTGDHEPPLPPGSSQPC